MRKRLHSRHTWGHRRWLSRAQRERRILAYRLLAVVCGLAILVAVLDTQLRPVVRAFTITQSKTLVTTAVNEAVEQVLQDRGVQYSDLVAVSKNTDGEIISIESDILKINELKASLTNAVLDELKHQKTQSVSIPLGTLIGGDLFNGRGPAITVRVSMTATAQTDMRSEFISAGINQTNHQIWMDIDMQLCPALPGYTSHVKVSTKFLIAETVLLGRVPDSFTDVDGDQSDLVGRIFDYSVNRKD